MVVTLRTMENVERFGLLKVILEVAYQGIAVVMMSLGLPVSKVTGWFVEETVKMALVEFREAIMAAENTLNNMFELQRMSLEDLKDFRQLHSKTPGHPECHETEGVEATTGPLGQGTGNAVGAALALKILAAKFNTAEHQIFDAKVFCLCSDGDMMEGVSHEVCALAGHLKLDNLIFIYDANNISLDGPLVECCTEDTAMRFQSYGWQVHKVDGGDLEELHETISAARENQSKPVMIIARTVIGKGSPNKAGTSNAHGSPLGPDEVLATKRNLDWPEEEFYIPKAVESFFQEKLIEDEKF
ncbi:MAG: hypothetical protein EBR79_02240, partial [Proteobacteria bacterium]|nr:hypothetical protein [Pseudomonadota bacterium]